MSVIVGTASSALLLLASYAISQPVSLKVYFYTQHLIVDPCYQASASTGWYISVALSTIYALVFGWRAVLSFQKPGYEKLGLVIAAMTLSSAACAIALLLYTSPKKQD
eukprot:TRINITY_DN12648_c1_g2_i16.p4 TRINITY_DN12648_c1_g2~~TRINITY_DN12648_c1_g2_i16.p4  ORF type:complete len:108 (-),score=11.23 TRINITY_DN12648_c1_g2_i16:313-636(-)